MNTTSPAQTVTLTNSGTGTVTFNSNGITMSGNYADRSPVEHRWRRTISVTFTPTTTGTLTGTLSIASNATARDSLFSSTGREEQRDCSPPVAALLRCNTASVFRGIPALPRLWATTYTAAANRADLTRK